MKSSATPANSVPMPEVALAAKVRAAKNSPSSRRPVEISLSSTMSASIELCTMPNMMMRVTEMMACATMIGNRSGVWFSGNQPSRRSATGATPQKMEIA